MKKKLMFLVATALLVVNVIYLVKAENCQSVEDCMLTTVSVGFTLECVNNVCTPVPDDGDPLDGYWMAVFAGNGMDVVSWECKYTTHKDPECKIGTASIAQPF